MTWAQARRLRYSSIVLAVLIAIGGFVYYKVTDVVPTCFDGRKNGDELGVDCGGGCSLYCANTFADPKVRWVRTFPVTPGLVHAIAYIEHGYPTAAAREATYSFKLYDERNSLIIERTGVTYIGPMGKSAIVDTLIPIGAATPARVQFAFTAPMRWQKILSSFASLVIKTDRTSLEIEPKTTRAPATTRLAATLENQSRYSFDTIDVIAILYDVNGNALAVSKSILPELPAQQNTMVYFTWPYEVEGVSRIEILPRINPFDSTLL